METTWGVSRRKKLSISLTIKCQMQQESSDYTKSEKYPSMLRCDVMIEPMLSVYEVLGSIPSTKKEKEKWS
jgi:hypothetical protein